MKNENFVLFLAALVQVPVFIKATCPAILVTNGTGVFVQKTYKESFWTVANWSDLIDDGQMQVICHNGTKSSISTCYRMTDTGLFRWYPESLASFDCCQGVKCAKHSSCNLGACECDRGWNGTDCQAEVPFCRAICLNGGSCVGLNQCICPEQWTGTYCEKGTEPSEESNWEVVEELSFFPNTTNDNWDSYSAEDRYSELRQLNLISSWCKTSIITPKYIQFKFEIETLHRKGRDGEINFAIFLARDKQIFRPPSGYTLNPLQALSK